MTKNECLLVAGMLAFGGAPLGCSSDKGAVASVTAATGGIANGIGSSSGGGSSISNGGSSSGGSSISNGGSSGGSSISSGGGSSTLQQGTGGLKATGGSTAAMGGTPQSSGGTPNGTGGTATKPTGGSALATGGSPGSGGTLGSGGTPAPTGGTPSSGGSSSGSGGTTSIDPSVSFAINACIDKLPYGGRDLTASQRAPIVTAIVNACSAFAPPGVEWQTWCQMFLVGAINAESSFDSQAGTTGAGGDPSVGLLQIRFSSVVLDFANYGPVDTLTRLGCNFGTVTSSDSYATKGAMMVDVGCNVAIGAWYYFIFASGNGGSSVVWVDQYCSGGGVAGTLHIGMASFLMGGDAAHSSLSGADYYVNEIKGWFDPCVTYTGTHPFELPIQPNTSQYCR